MRKLDRCQREQVISTLVAGHSLRVASESTGVSRNTVAKLLEDLGQACIRYQNAVLGQLHCKRLYSFTKRIRRLSGSREGLAAPSAMRSLCLDLCALTAIDPDTKIVPEVWVTNFDELLGETEQRFLSHLSDRFEVRPVTGAATERTQQEAGVDAFFSSEDPQTGARRVTLFQCKNSDKPQHTDGTAQAVVPLGPVWVGAGFSKPVQKHSGTRLQSFIAAIAVYLTYYNFARVSRNVGVTPAMAAGVAARQWHVADLVGLLEDESKKTKSEL